MTVKLLRWLRFRTYQKMKPPVKYANQTQKLQSKKIGKNNDNETTEMIEV